MFYSFAATEDPYETTNLAKDPAHQQVLQELIEFIRDEHKNNYEVHIIKL